MRSVVERGQIALPLGDGANEPDALANVLPQKQVLLSMEANRKEYPAQSITRDT